jgi:hypothetical protein
MLSRRLFNWFFYGHIWIALAATGLSWLSLRIVYGEQSCVAESPILTFIFFATLGVYTLHRYLSFQRAEKPPSTSRYNIVARHPQMSLWIGGLSVAIAGYFSLDYITIIWPALLLALPLTIFYLTPPLSGWRRLRDLPYLKNLWVALAWTIMTVVVPVIVLESRASIFRHNQSNDLSGLISLYSCGYVAPLDYSNLYLELAIRFLFTGCVALLFDLRDVALDRSQEVRTIAGQLPTLHRTLVYGGLFTCAVLSLFLFGRSCIVPNFPSALAGAYLLMIPVAYFTYSKTDEAWYAVVVNGLLLLPPFLYFLWGVLDIWGAGAGAGLG